MGWGEKGLQEGGNMRRELSLEEPSVVRCQGDYDLLMREDVKAM